MRDSGIGSFIACAVIGGLIGAAIGLLIAPEPGERLREQVGGFVDERRAAFGEAVNEGRAAAEIARAGILGKPDAGDAPGAAAAEAATS
jgi:gas vesicle protein